MLLLQPHLDGNDPLKDITEEKEKEKKIGKNTSGVIVLAQIIALRDVFI